MNLGRYVFAQVVDFVPRYLFNKIVSKYKGDFHAKELNSYSQLLHLLFGQLTGCSSLHEICLCLLAHSDILYHLGIRKTVRISSLARANEKRDYHIFEELGLNLIQSVRPLYAKTAITDVCVDNVLYALDSTTISTSIKLAAWALGKYSKGAVKMHALLDLRGSVPAQIHISDGKWHDSNMLELITYEPGAIYTADKAYVDLEQMWRMNLAGAFFVMRPKNNMKFEVIRVLNGDDKPSTIRSDYIVRLVVPKSKKLYPDELRLVKALDPDSGEIITFVTNNFDFPAIEIANIYRHRWDIEVFFKWIKQNICIKRLWGYSENAVKTHLWVAVCAYLLLAKIKHAYDSSYSVTEIASLIRLSALEKVPLRKLLSKPSESINSNQNVKEPTLFDSL